MDKAFTPKPPRQLVNRTPRTDKKRKSLPQVCYELHRHASDFKRSMSVFSLNALIIVENVIGKKGHVTLKESFRKQGGGKTGEQQ